MCRSCRPQVVETTALGAAYAAGLAVGFWSGPQQLAAHWSIDKRWRPSMSESRRSALYGAWQKAISRSLDWCG